MVIQEVSFILKDGRQAILRSPGEEDAEAMLAFFTRACGETDFLLLSPEELKDYTLEREQTLLRDMAAAPERTMIACYVEGKLAGNCQIVRLHGLKQRHRAGVAIALLREYWGLGIGTRMFEELIALARSLGGVRQLELDFIEGNSRARALYEKMGFRITGVKPDAICLRDGTLVNEYMMIKRL